METNLTLHRRWRSSAGRLRSGILVLVLGCASWPIFAAPENITDVELAQVPPYCQDVNTIRYGDSTSNTSPRAGYWVGLLGKPFWALHHYCWGLIHVLRSKALGVPPVQRTGMVTAAIGDYMYVLHNAPRDFVLAPEIYLRIGEAKAMLGQSADAQDAFRTSRELKPDYWPAYTRAIDELLKSNQKVAAKALALEGLRNAPTSKELLDRYRKLGGDPSQIIAIAAAPSASSATSDGAATAAPDAAASAPSPTGR